MHTHIIGIDEAGRGPLAGPVVVGAVCIPSDVTIEHEHFAKGVVDSKKLTQKRREELFAFVTEHKDITHAAAFVSASRIDAVGLTQAIQEALDEALSKVAPHVPAALRVLLDGGLHAPACYTSQETIVKGDEKEVAIALASVVAKVSRDRYMKAMADKYPHYDFEKHKGYGTKVHFAAIKEHGLCPEHRRLFLRKFLAQ